MIQTLFRQFSSVVQPLLGLEQEQHCLSPEVPGGSLEGPWGSLESLGGRPLEGPGRNSPQEELPTDPWRIPGRSLGSLEVLEGREKVLGDPWKSLEGPRKVPGGAWRSLEGPWRFPGELEISKGHLKAPQCKPCSVSSLQLFPGGSLGVLRGPWITKCFVSQCKCDTNLVQSVHFSCSTNAWTRVSTAFLQT